MAGTVWTKGVEFDGGLAMNRCPHCHQIIPPEVHLRGKKQAAIYEIVAKHPEGVKRNTIIDYMYQLDPNGGPDNAVDCFYVMVGNLNENLKKYKVKIEGSVRTGSYRLVSIDPNIPSREQILWHEAAAAAFSTSFLYPYGT
jgi:hypothetical protein